MQETTIKAYCNSAMEERGENPAPTRYQVYCEVAAYVSQPLRGKLHRKAFYALCYGASIQRTAKISGLSLRRVKAINKQLTRY